MNKMSDQLMRSDQSQKNFFKTCPMNCESHLCPSAATQYLARIEKQQNKECRIVCGYEAGCLGYSLYHQLHAHGVDCVILAPATMMAMPGKRIKTDRRDARLISKCLASHTYSPVYIPTELDDAVIEYIRMRDDANSALVRVKQQIIASCIRHGKVHDGKSYWTNKHLDWLSNLDFGNGILSEVLQEYLIRYYQLREQMDIYDMRINELAQAEPCREKAEKLGCFRGIAAHTALSFCVEAGDFRRFATAQQFASYLGLVLGECSSGDKQQYTGITKAGNAHLRKLLVETAQVFRACLKKQALGFVRHKSTYFAKKISKMGRSYLRGKEL